MCIDIPPICFWNIPPCFFFKVSPIHCLLAISKLLFPFLEKYLSLFSRYMFAFKNSGIIDL